MTTLYKILFTVELLHEYYTNLRCKDFLIVPSADTAAFLRNQQMLYKLVGNQLIVLIKVSDTNSPFVTINAQQKFLFYMELANPVFTTITNLDLDRFPRQRFYFTNLNQNAVNSGLSLSSAIDNYNNTLTYKPGDFAKDEDNVYECIQTTTGGNETGDDTFWHLRGNHQYASAIDMLTYVTRVNNYLLSVPAKEFSIKVFGLDTDTNGYDREVTIEENHVYADSPTNVVQTNLKGLPPGRYIVDINSEQFNVFVDDHAVYDNVFGVIEIFCHLPGDNEFALLDDEGKVKDQDIPGAATWLNFQVRFANRLAYWKYISLRNGINDILDNTGPYNFTEIPMPPPPLPPPPSDMFLSNVPIPMNQTPKIFSLQLATSHSSEPPVAPNPDPDVTGMLNRFNNDYYCNIYLNY